MGLTSLDEGETLALRECVPCKGGIPPLKGDPLRDLLTQLNHNWRIIGERSIEKEYNFKNFRDALDFANKVGTLAEQQNHHPDLFVSWGKVIVSLWTHKINGLSESDFILAAKIDKLEK